MGARSRSYGPTKSLGCGNLILSSYKWKHIGWLQRQLNTTGFYIVVCDLPILVVRTVGSCNSSPRIVAIWTRGEYEITVPLWCCTVRYQRQYELYVSAFGNL